MFDIPLNSAGRMASTFVNSKLTPLFILFCTLVGILAVLTTPREENPQIVVPAASITFMLPGASPEEIENLIIIPMEGILREIEGVDHTYTMASRSVGQINVQFEVSENKENAMLRIFQRIHASSHRLPSGTLSPVIQRVDIDDVPIVTVTLTSDKYDDYALKRMAERVSETLSTIEEVSVTGIHGGQNREIRIDIDPERLQAYGITLTQITQMLAASNLSSELGHQVSGGSTIIFSLDGYLNSAEQIQKLAVGEHQGQLIYLEDLAKILDGPPSERTHLTRFGYGPADPGFSKNRLTEMPAVTISAAKKQGTNSVVVADAILARIDKMKQQLLPPDVEVVVTRNDGQNADQTVNDLIINLFIAISAVLLVLFFTLGWKEALIVSLTVPLILCLTLFGDLLVGPTINRLSLFGLILSLGMIVDAAIVTIENIHRHYQTSSNPDQRMITVLATNEIGKPTNMATLAIMLVFSSLFIVTGMNGEFFYPIVFNVPVAMATSLLVAYIVIPWAANRWLKPGEGKALENHQTGNRLHRTYYKIITPVLDKKWVSYTLFTCTLLFLLIGFVQPAWQFIRAEGVSGPLSAGGVNLSVMPKDDKNTFNITIDMPENTPIEVTDQVTRLFGDLLRQEPLVANYQTYVGLPGVIDFTGQIRGNTNRIGSHLAEIRVNLINKKQRETQSMTVVSRLRKNAQPIFEQFPDMDVRLVEDPPGPPVRGVILAEIYGQDPEQLRAISQRVKQQFRETYQMIDIYDTQSAQVPQINITVDKEKAVLSGVTTADILTTLQGLLGGINLSRAPMPGEKNSVPIRLQVPRDKEITAELLDRVFVNNRHGEAVPLSELTQLTFAHQPPPLLRKDNERVTYVGGNVDQSAPVYAILEMDEKLNGLPLSDGSQLSTHNIELNAVLPDSSSGYQLLWDGELRLTLDAVREMNTVLAAALVCIYLLLVATYKSFVIPLIAMITIPLGFSGVFPGHWIMDVAFSMPSMIGTVALSGVVIRNALLLIDFIQDYQAEGHELKEAVKLAGAVRFRPVLLTAITIVLGTMVMYSDPMFAGLATSLIFGTTASTLLTLIIIPALYYLYAARLERKGLSLIGD